MTTSEKRAEHVKGLRGIGWPYAAALIEADGRDLAALDRRLQKRFEHEQALEAALRAMVEIHPHNHQNDRLLESMLRTTHNDTVRPLIAARALLPKKADDAD